MSLLGIVLGLVLLMFLAYRGYSIIWVAPVCAVVVAVLSGYAILDAYIGDYMKGMADYVFQWFPPFFLGAVYGKVMDMTGSARSLGNALVKLIGSRFAVLAVVLPCLLMTFGGISLFVVVFVIYPMGYSIYRAADLPRTLLPGAIATGGYGTALGVVRAAHAKGNVEMVYCDETRPLLQGARLTSYELQRAGVDVTLICDNMASIVMRNGWVQACFVGCDRIAANGDTANKIGTSGVAILAKHYGIPVYVLGPTSTIDMSCPDGDHIPIEERDGEEIKTMWYEKPMALPEVKCYNPAFDVTDHDLIAGIVTEKGICRPPYTKSLKALFDDKK